jgi:general secretion pathway protein I
VKSRGFTLIEVMVALAIVAFGLTALFATTTQTVDASAYLRDKTLAQWIALNRITEARLEGKPPEDEDMSGELEYAGLSWRWELRTIATPVKGIVRLEARVALNDSAEKSWPGFATGFMGDALTPPGSAAPNWLGEPGSGKPPGQQPPAAPPGSEPAPGEPPPDPSEDQPQ